MKFIGDVHGKFTAYEKLIRAHKDTIQVGDMGVGFFKTEPDGSVKAHRNPPYDKMVASNARFIRGNHDNPNLCKRHTQWIPDGHLEDGMMFIGGGISIDKAYRYEGLDYWCNEELNMFEFQPIVKKYFDAKPEIMVTHDCPEWVLPIMGHRLSKLDEPSLTRRTFAFMHQGHKPKLWVFGHWHKSFDKAVGGTRFVCLAELEMKDLEL
jgi:hypothetical protein